MSSTLAELFRLAGLERDLGLDRPFEGVGGNRGRRSEPAIEVDLDPGGLGRPVVGDEDMVPDVGLELGVGHDLQGVAESPIG